MIVMSDARCSKANQLRELARQFRLKAGETVVPDYIELMTRYAAEFDKIAEHIEAGGENAEGRSRSPGGH